MATERLRRLTLGVLLAVLGMAVYFAWGGGPQGPQGSQGSQGSTSGGAASPSSNRAASTRPGAGAAAPATAPDVHLQALDAQRPTPESGRRDLFRFGQRPAPPPPAVAPPPASVTAQRGAPAGPSLPPPIPLRFIGIVEAPTQSKRIAALVDSSGHAYQGGEGDIVAGQYRVLKIGVESIEMAYLDGRGRQTIRLSGS